MSRKLSLKGLQVGGKKVLMRVDFNVPLDSQQNITDDSRIVAALPSIKYVLDGGGSLVLMSHLGRPKGKDPKLSLAPVAKRLSKLLGEEVVLAPDCIGVKDLDAKVVLLENLRFHEEEKKGDLGFAKELASYGDLYVNDAFGTCHRKHASTYVVPSLFENAAGGFLVEKEIAFLGYALMDPKRPFIAIIGGAKISSKLSVLEALVEKADHVLIGGAMAYTFLKAKGVKVGNSLVEDDLMEEAKKIEKSGKITLPVDIIVAKEIKEGAKTLIVKGDIPEGFEGVGIGPETVALYEEKLEGAKTVFWNGPLGVFEVPSFASGTFAIAEVLSRSLAVTIVGGGDSAAAVKKLGLESKFDHISTGGGASLEYIDKGQLPGIQILSDV